MTDPITPWLSDYPDHLAWDMKIEQRSMVDAFDDTTLKYADHAGFDFLGKTYSWGELGNLTNRFAAGLQNEMGIQKGDKVGLLLPNSPIFLIAYYAILKIGATVVNYNPLYAESELAHQIEDSETDIMVTFDLKMLYEKADKMLSGTRLKRIVLCKFTDILPAPKSWLFPIFKRGEMARLSKSAKTDKRIFHFRDLINNDGSFTPAKIDVLSDLAVLQYTGGTTGVPKGAMLTHYSIYANAIQSTSWFGDIKHGEDKMLGVLPFFHVFAMTAIMNLSIIAGLEIIALPRFELSDTLKVIDEKKPQFFPAVPAIYNAINNHPKLKDYDLSSIKYCISGGAPLPVEVKKNFEAVTGCVVVEGYGLSESSPVATINPLKGTPAKGSIGKPVPNTIIEIIDADDKTTPIPLGERGELCISGPQVMKGYWKNKDASADVLRKSPDGRTRLHTGDVAVMDKAGFIYIVDRLKDMIITNGYNVYPRNIEEAIHKHPNVEECIVAGLPHKQRGEIVKAWIKLKDERELTEADLRSFLNDKLSKMEMPKQIEFRASELPKTMIGKLSRKDIVEEELAKKA